MDLAIALQRLHTDDGQAAQVVLEALQRLAERLARKHGIDLDRMQDLANEVVLKLLETPTPCVKDDPGAFLHVCLMNRLRSWARSRAARTQSLDQVDGRSGVESVGPPPAWSAFGDPGDPGSRSVAGRSVATDPDAGDDEGGVLASTLEQTRAFAREHLQATDGATLEGLIAICLKQTEPADEAERLGIALNALQARQTRARRKALARLKELSSATEEPDELKRLLRIARLVEALRERHNP